MSRYLPFTSCLQQGQFGSIGACVRATVKHEGPSALYKGLAASLVGSSTLLTPRRTSPHPSLTPRGTPSVT